MGKVGKILKCVGGAVVAVAAAPVVLPAAAAVGTAVAGSAVGTAVAGAATAASTAVAGSVVGTAVAGAATAASTAVAGSAVGTAVAGAATAASTAVAGSAIGSTVAATAATLGVTTATIGAATVGAGLTYSGLTSMEGFLNSIEADEKISEAKRIYNNINNKLDKAQKKTINKMQNLNQLKVSIYANEIKESIEIIEKIKNIQQTDTTISEFKFNFTQEEIKEVKKTSVEAAKIAKNSLDGLGTSVAMSSLTTSLVSNFGIASTGTAISSLSGVAAQNATLAALGGGAKAVGGAGMAGGRVMLGGIALVPTTIIMSHKYAQNAEKKLTESIRYYSEIRQEVGKIEQTISWLENSVNTRVDEIYNTLEKFRIIYSREMIWRLKGINDYRCKNGKINMNECTSDEKDIIIKSCKFISCMKEIIKAPVLTENGLINEETKNILDVYGDINKLYV